MLKWGHTLINLICFPHYTAGGLLCDILNDTFSSVGPHGGINSIAHKLGKIGDMDTVLVNYDVSELLKQVEQIPDNVWVGTHCWPARLPHEKFNKIINVTTTTHRSKCYRWSRSYYHYFVPEWKSLNLTGMELIDKCRETAKNYLVPFEPVFAENVINIEFADIVENTQEFQRLIPKNSIKKHLERWQQLNDFLYDKQLWNHDLVKFLFQAEAEIQLNRYYIYE